MLEQYVVIDLEMTGLHAKTDKILELGAVRIRNRKQIEVFSAIVNPGVPVPREVIELTGITNEMAEKGKNPDETMTEFLTFIGEDILVGQNIIFDYSFLKQWAVNHKIKLEKQAVDTLKLARKFLPEEQKKDLESLCLYYGIKRENAHRALDDAIETGMLLEKLREAFEETDPEAFLPKQLQYKAKKQTPATEQQKKYLQQFAQYHGIKKFELPEGISKSEASRLTDQLIARYGKMNKSALANEMHPYG